MPTDNGFLRNGPSPHINCTDREGMLEGTPFDWTQAETREKLLNSTHHGSDRLRGSGMVVNPVGRGEWSIIVWFDYYSGFPTLPYEGLPLP